MAERVAEVRTDAALQVLDLGLTPFAETLARQEELVRLLELTEPKDGEESSQG